MYLIAGLKASHWSVVLATAVILAPAPTDSPLFIPSFLLHQSLKLFSAFTAKLDLLGPLIEPISN